MPGPGMIVDKTFYPSAISKKRKTYGVKIRKQFRAFRRKNPGVGYGMTYNFKRMADEIFVMTNNMSGVNVTGVAANAGLFNIGAITTNPLGNNNNFGLTWIFRLQDVTNYTEFTALYDQYKIKSVSVKIDYMTDPLISGNANVVAQFPEIYYVLDPDDGTALGSLAAAQEYQSCKVMKLTNERTFHKRFYPKSASLVYKTSGTTVGFMTSTKNDWKDCSFSDIEHYGIKFYVSNMTDSVGFGTALRIQFRYQLAFRNVR